MAEMDSDCGDGDGDQKKLMNCDSENTMDGEGFLIRHTIKKAKHCY